MTRSRLISLVIVAIVAIGVGAYLAYDNVLRGDAAAPLALPSAQTAIADPTASSAPAASASAAVAESAAPAPTDGTVTGATVTSPAPGRWSRAARPATGSASSSPTSPPNPMPSAGRAMSPARSPWWRRATAPS